MSFGYDDGYDQGNDRSNGERFDLPGLTSLARQRVGPPGMLIILNSLVGLMIAVVTFALVVVFPEVMVSTMKQVVRLAPKDDRYLAVLGDFEREAGLFADGLAHAQAALKLNDKQGGYHVVAAACAYGSQDVPLARPSMPEPLKSASNPNNQFEPACQLYPASTPPCSTDRHWPRRGGVNGALTTTGLRNGK